MDRQWISRIERMEASIDRLLGSNLRVTVRGGGSGGGGNIVFKNAETKAALDLILLEGEIGYTTGTTKYYYCKLDDVTLAFSHTE